MAGALPYSAEELFAAYELGRQLFEAGDTQEAERIFRGLVVVDGGITPARVGLGVLRLEQGLFEEAVVVLRQAAIDSNYALHAQLGLAAAFIAMGDATRAIGIFEEVEKERNRGTNLGYALERLFQAFSLRANELQKPER